MADGLRQVAALVDPVGEVASGWKRPNGLMVTKVRFHWESWRLFMKLDPM